MTDHDLLSCSPMATTSNEFNFNLRIKQGLIQKSASTSSQSYSHSKDRFFKKKKIIINKSSSPLLHLYLHLFHFLIMNKSSYFKKKKKIQSKFSIPWKNSRFPNFSKKKKNQFFLNLSKKKKIINQNFQFLEKIQDFQILSKKKIKILSSLKKF